MRNYLVENFNRYYDSLTEEILDEVAIRDFKQDNTNLYHFFTDFSHLINSLNTNAIYTDKNAKKSQFDTNAPNDCSFLCLTQTAGGKEQITSYGNRNYGISFDINKLKDFCKEENYIFDERSFYNQFKEKSSYRGGKRVQYVFDNKDFSDFEIFAIGELEEGNYFISGGQSPSFEKLWKARFFNDAELYHILLDWFLKNMQSNDSHKECYYYFKNSNLGEPTQTYTDKYGTHIINCSGNLNKNYKPRQNKDDPNKFNATIDFNFTNLKFKELIGIGPVKFVDSYKDLRNIKFVSEKTIRGYVGPKFYGKPIDNKYPTDNQLVGSRIDSKESNKRQYNFVANKQTLDKLSEVFTENELRIYIPNKKDFKLPYSIIDSIILPEYYTFGNTTFNLKLLAQRLEKAKSYLGTSSIDVLFNKFIKDGIVIIDSNGTSKLKETPYAVKNNLNALIVFFRKDLKDVIIEFVPDRVDTFSKNQYTDYNLTGNGKQEPISTIPKNTQHLRQVVSEQPDINSTKTITKKLKGDNADSVFAPLVLQDNTQLMVRVGAEVVLKGYDEQQNEYILMAERADKSPGFLELPGGGIESVNEKPIDAIKRKLKFKGNIEPSAIRKLKYTGRSLLLDEKDVAKSNDVYWEYSYYYLFSAEYTKTLTEQDLVYSFDNSELAKSKNINGYTSYMKWIPTDKNSIKYNQAITSRYAGILDDFIIDKHPASYRYNYKSAYRKKKELGDNRIKYDKPGRPPKKVINTEE